MKDGAYAPPAPFKPWYIEGRLGVPFSSDMEADASNTFGAAGDATIDVDYDEAYFGGIALGRYLTPNWRVEAALGFGRASDPTIDFKVADPTNLFQGPVPSMGSMDAFSGYGYLIHDFRNFGNGRIIPFAGIGGGFVRYSAEGLRPVGSFFVIDDSDTVASFAWLAGLEFPVSERFSLTARYSGAFTDGPSFTDTRGGGVQSVEADSFVTHYLAAGIKIPFGGL